MKKYVFFDYIKIRDICFSASVEVSWGAMGKKRSCNNWAVLSSQSILYQNTVEWQMWSICW